MLEMKSFREFLIFYAFIESIFIAILCKSETVFDVTKFGADSKGTHKSSDAINRAIAAAVGIGGGTVYFPKGEYLTGPIHLKTNTTIHLADNAIVKFSTDFDDYLPMVQMRWEGTVVNSFSPLIYAYRQQNIVIKGKGIFDGQGRVWLDYWRKLKGKDSKYQKEFFRLNNMTELKSETEDMSRLDIGFLRPPFVQPFDSKNILIEDITFRNSPFWNLNPVLCQKVVIRGVRIESPNPSPNTDGIDPDSCKDVIISKVFIDVGDDCIAIKSGRDLQGRRLGRPTENVLISDSIIRRGGGVSIGSEMSGGVRNVTIRDCVFNGTDRGIYIKSMRGRGGVVENINCKNILMTNIKKEAIILHISPSYALKHKKNGTAEQFTDRTPVIRNIEFTDIRGDAHYSGNIAGIPESLIENIKLTEIDIKSKSGFIANYTNNLQILKYSIRKNQIKF